MHEKSVGLTKNRGVRQDCGEKDFFVLNFLFLFVSRQKERGKESQITL
jgi:hypothetical protein